MDVEFLQLALVPLLIGVFASIACTLPGNFLILRQQALIGDAISHVVLPGIVVAFLMTGKLNSWPMLLGAAGAATIYVILIELIKYVGKIEPGAAMGVVFTTLFAAGLLLLEQSNSASVHLDVEHALFGNLESLVWLDAEGWHSLLDLDTLAQLPDEFWRLLIVALLMLLLVWLFWRPLKISTFDPDFATAIGLPVRLISFILIMASALAAVAAFDAVGSIIVIAMFICPAAAARLLMQNLAAQMWVSVLFATLCASLGYMLAGYAPQWLGISNGLSAAGMIATVLGMTLVLCALFKAKTRHI